MRVRTRYTKLVFLHPGRYAGHIVHSGAFVMISGTMGTTYHGLGGIEWGEGSTMSRPNRPEYPG
jgi:hypothetical protein